MNEDFVDLRDTTIIRTIRLILIGLTAVAAGAVFGLRISNPFWLFTCGLPLAALIRLEYELLRDRREREPS